MKIPSPKVLELADVIVCTEVARDDIDAAQLAAAERLLGAMQEELILLIGGTGFDALLDRAFRRAGSKRSVTEGARDHKSASEARRNLRADLDGMPARDVHGALVAIIAELIALLARLIGADLTARLVHRTWPGVVPWLTAAHLEDGDG